ncbi:MAG: NADP-specific glutamate dehydrogenase [Lautropia sp.]
MTHETSDGFDAGAFIDALKTRTPGEHEFHEAVAEIVRDLEPVIAGREDLRALAVLERLVEPDRIVSFRVAWEDDAKRVRVNRGWRVQFNSAIGPYKGGLRFHPGVNASVLKFLAFEQTFKNALTGLPKGGGKGGADFDPRGCSDREIMRFCQALMVELQRYIDPDVDVPAGDINVGAREIGYLFGAYKRITGEFEGVLTGKGLSYGGSQMRTEATGYGLVHFVAEMLRVRDASLEGQVVLVSGAGNVATHAAQKAGALGARVVTLSDSGGLLHLADGFTPDAIDAVRRHKARPGASLEGCAKALGAQWHPGRKPWGIDCTLALPCATQNELDAADAKALVDGGCRLVAEGANMPCTPQARRVFADARIPLGPGKAANAGCVAVSGFEISQNETRRYATRDAIEADLVGMMRAIHARCLEHGTREDGWIDYGRGANLAGFRRIADAMIAQGIG